MNRLVAVAFAVLCATAAARAYAEKPVPILIQVEPGFNPDAIQYEKEAVVFVNGKRLGGTFTITDQTSDQKEIRLHKLAASDTLTVSATFTDGGAPVTCERTWVAISEDSIGCGPIEISYQPSTNTCLLVCN